MKRIILASLVIIAVTTVSSLSLASQRIDDVIHDQLDAIEKQGFTLPPLTIATFEPLFNGKTVIAERSVRYVVVITEYSYFSEASVRRTTTHEIGHVLLDVHGVANSEANANRFAACVLGEASGIECDELFVMLR